MKLSVSKKLSGLVGGLILVLLTVTLTFYFSMGNLLKGFDQLSEVVGGKMEAAMEAKVQLQYAVHEYKNYLIRGKDKYRESWYQHVNKLKEALDRYEELIVDKEKRSFLQEARARLIAYGQSMPELERAMRSTKDIKELDRAVKGVDRPLMEILEKMDEKAMKEQKSEMILLDTRSTKIKTILLVVTFVAVLLSSIVAMIIVKGILKAIHEVKRGIKRVSGGDLSCEILRLSDDEFGDIADDFNHMIKKLRQMVGNINDISVNIASSAEELSLIHI